MKKILLTLVLMAVCLKVKQQQHIKILQPFTEKDVYDYIVKVGISHPKIVFTQAKLESGNFKSNIFKQNKNMFGMKLPERRQTTAVGVKNNHSVYTSWRSSIEDYKIWQDTYASKYKTKSQYLKYLASYAEDKEYINKIEKNLL